MLRVALWVGLALALVGCKRKRLEDVRFDKLESLPGFDLGLPAGERLRSEIAPTAGQIMIKATSALVVVGWQAGRIAQDDLPVFGQTTVQSLGAAFGAGASEQQELTLPAPNYGVQMLLPTDKDVILVLSLVQCVHANVTVTLATMAARDRTAALAFHARLQAAMRCREDGPPLVVASGLPAFDTGDAIAYLPGSDPPSFHGPSGERWIITPGTGSQRKAYEDPKVVASMFSGLGLEILDQERVPHPGPASWLVLRLTARFGDERGKLLMGLLDCGADLSFGVIYIKLGTEPDLAPLDRVSCPTGPIDPSTLPTVSARFGAACDGGDARACVALALLIDEEPALLPDQDAAAVRAKACKLGVAAACAAP